MQEQNESKVAILINPGKAYSDAFSNKNTCLYIPVDENGQMVDVKHAVKLECWTPGERNEQIPKSTTFTAIGIVNSLVKQLGDHEFCTLSRSVAYGSLAKMDYWLHTLHRHEEGDYTNISVYQNS